MEILVRMRLRVVGRLLRSVISILLVSLLVFVVEPVVD